jgi:hypothetical protein
MLQIVPASKIRAFLADREFIGAEWFSFLRDRDVPFCIRVKKDTTVEAGNGTWGPAWWLFKDLPVMGSADGKTETHGTIRALSKECGGFGQEGLHLVVTRYVGREGKAEYLLVLKNSDPEEAIHRYRRRWEIETLFGAMKSRSFDPEATHLRAPGRYSQADRAIACGLRLGAPGWAMAPGTGGPTTAQNPWALGEERLSVRP